MGGSRSSKTKMTIRFAPYLEQAHMRFLEDTFSYGDVAIEDSPFTDYEESDTEEAFFGIGLNVCSYAPLYQMFGKFMAGLDIEEVFESSLDEMLSKEQVNDTTEASIALIDQKYLGDIIPQFKADARALNAVSSSSFVIASTNIERARLKEVAEVSSNNKLGMLNTPHNKFLGNVTYQKSVITDYAVSMKQYYMTTMSNDTRDRAFDARNTLWPFTVLDFERAALFPFRRNGSYEKKMPRVRSTVSGVLMVLSDTVTGAYIGFQCGGYVGAIVGAIIGFVVGVAKWIFE